MTEDELRDLARRMVYRDPEAIVESIRLSTEDLERLAKILREMMRRMKEPTL